MTQSLLHDADELAFDRLARIASKALGADGGKVTLRGDRRSYLESTFALGQHVLATRVPLVIDNAHEHPVAQDRGVGTDGGLGAYLGVPMVTRADHVVGTVSVHGRDPRAWTEAETETLQDIARMAVDVVESQHAIRTYQDREATSRLLFDQSAVPSAHVDLHGVIRAANRRFTERLGYADDGLDGTVASVVVDPSQLEAMTELHRTVLVGDVSEAEMPTRLVRRDGDVITATVRWMVVRNAAGAAQYSLVTIVGA